MLSLILLTALTAQPTQAPPLTPEQARLAVLTAGRELCGGRLTENEHERVQDALIRARAAVLDEGGRNALDRSEAIGISAVYAIGGSFKESARLCAEYRSELRR